MSLTNLGSVPRRGHVAAFYDTDEFLVEQAASFIADGLSGDGQVIVLATLPHWNAITARLEETGVAYGRAGGEDRLVLIDAEHVLDSILVEGHACVDAFRAILRPLIKPGPKLRIYGEVVSLLMDRGDVEGAVAIERIGHELTRADNVSILCGYQTTGGRIATADISRIEETHDHNVYERTRAEMFRPEFHAVRFYENRESLVRIVGTFLGEGFATGRPAIVIATPAHRAAISDALATRGFDADRLETAGDLIMVDAEETLARFMIDGLPDRVRFRDAVIPLIERACRGREDCTVRAYGEMVDVLWKAGQTDAAVRLETLWNQLAQTHAFALLCGYSMGHFYKRASRPVICDQHTHLVDDAGRAIAFQ